MQKKPCEKFLKLPQNRRFNEFSIFMNFMRGANTHIMVAKNGDQPGLHHISVTGTWHLHEAPS